METQKIKASLTQGESKKLTLRIWLTQEQKDLFVLEKGTQPETIMSVVVI